MYVDTIFTNRPFTARRDPKTRLAPYVTSRLVRRQEVTEIKWNMAMSYLVAEESYALVRSKLEYCCAIWDPHQVGEVNKLEGVQRNAARFVCGEDRRGSGISVTALLKELQWPSLADRRLIASLTLFYNAHTGKVSIPLCNLLDRSDSRTRGAKNNYKYL